MTRTKLYLLLTLLKAYRATLTWSVSRRKDGHDDYRLHADAVIADIRFALKHDGFYRADELMVRPCAPVASPHLSGRV